MSILPVTMTMSDHTRHYHRKSHKSINALVFACKTREYYFCMIHLVVYNCNTLVQV
jgi:hypothetical protein